MPALRRFCAPFVLAVLASSPVAASVWTPVEEHGAHRSRFALTNGVERTAPPQQADLAVGAVPLTTDGELIGAVWLEGERFDRYAVLASPWNGDSWGPVERVAPPAQGEQLALDAALLDDGSWLLVWSVVVGTDEDLRWSARREGLWSAPRAVSPDDHLDDTAPAVVSVPGGALLAWSYDDGRDYRIGVSRFDGEAWSPRQTWGGRGSLDPTWHESPDPLAGTVWLLHSHVDPGGWAVLEVAHDGTVLRRAYGPEISWERPRISATTDGIAFRWDEVEALAEGGASFEWLADWRVADPDDDGFQGNTCPQTNFDGSEPVEGGLFRYLAFGDSITRGKGCCTGQNDVNAYPGRVESMLTCGAGCDVVKRGKDGEQTAAGRTRLQDCLDFEGPWDVVLQMEGTNDVFHDRSAQNIQNNLSNMRSRSFLADTDTVYASIVWFDKDASGTTAARNAKVEDLRNRIRDNLATVQGHYFADPWDQLCPLAHTDIHNHNQNTCFNLHYEEPPGSVGHPEQSGYHMLGDHFVAVLEQDPVPTASTPLAPVGTTFDTTPAFTWDREVPTVSTWYELSIFGPTNFGNLYFHTSCTATQCNFVPVALAPGDYTWRVRGRSPRGWSPWTALQPFTVTTEAIFADGFESGNTEAWSSTVP